MNADFQNPWVRIFEGNESVLSELPARISEVVGSDFRSYGCKFPGFMEWTSVLRSRISGEWGTHTQVWNRSFTGPCSPTICLLSPFLLPLIQKSAWVQKHGLSKYTEKHSFTWGMGRKISLLWPCKGYDLYFEAGNSIFYAHWKHVI